MTLSSQSDVLIVGAGVAGLAASVALSGADAKVTQLERRPYIGGRAYSYPHPVVEETIDSQHVLVGCCTNLLDLCKLSGADQHLRWYDRIPFLEPATSSRPTRISEIGSGFLPAPSHAALSFLQASMLSARDKVGIATALLDFLTGYPATDEEPFSAWLQRAKQSPLAIKHFWEPVVISTLNDSFDRCSTRYAGQVFHELFLKSAQGGRQGIPTLPMSEFYAPFVRLAEQQGTTLYERASVDRIAHIDGLWHATLSTGEVHAAPSLLLAIPFEQTARLLKTLPEDSPQRDRILPSLDYFVYAPFTTIHVWFDRDVTDLDQAALLDTGIQWMFNKSRIRRGQRHQPTSGQYLELVIAASFAELHRTREDILSTALAELATFFPRVREANIVKTAILKEAKATFSVIPGLDRFRPTQGAPGDGLFLAGDWTRTGWPSTMEGAARSGRLAAEAIAAATGNATTFMSPDLPASGFMKLLPR